ncbi:type A chloramphenicol O-acetyltransferase [Paraclostridium bifermentans]|uniref:Chloramphenicol acetyltransferase n=1 Tax=Paraclostridium bifermentans TaxID=1490 RepID=A0A5P3XIY6_PARBF|nr:type A chloramphenicol O-acetyltransferase [Paraclostridium bifermentans]MBN8049194.1 type A chloramphenicol O-acetyltransferase [Paraclostridium bifermentans]MDM8127175.1 type A chloramphenicol O-acetyltransferase [Paraclostridium benzoelyticum]NME10782.1 type A chloramphenicol O-acetyltransferase [Paraclostridium bifermentans]QEZ70328.1 type A chloramphenicol O-acetyltransferase [Paraclostridium bifermentans]
MSFKSINKETWNRKEYFEHYFSEVPCTYSMTVKLDITKIKNSNKKIYPTMLYFITKVVNNHSEFRTAFNMDGELGVFDEMLPCYTVFNQDTETFTNIWTDYSDDYDAFCKSYEKDIELFSSVKGMIAKPNIPPNHFPVSMIPWTTFEGFNLNLQKGYNYLLPIFTMGKYSEINGQSLIPLAIQVHHAVCDGFHISRFVNELQKLIKE